jgi:hypothetical protein
MPVPAACLLVRKRSRACASLLPATRRAPVPRVTE